MRFLTTFAVTALALGASTQAGLLAQASAPAALGTVRLAHAVKANGQALPAGTYQVRLTSEAPAAVVGQPVTAAQWVEFVKGGTVAGREVATVVPADDMKTIAKMPRKGGAVRVETLKGGDYVRVWIMHGGKHFLIHLPATP